MTIEEYLALDNPLMYDFSNDGASEEYKKIKNPEKKFFVYMAINHPYCRNDNTIMTKGSKFTLGCKKTYGNIYDPDSESILLNEIYDILWKDESNESEESNTKQDPLFFCKKSNNTIKGDTLNSNNTTMISYYKNHIETISDKENRLAIPRQQVSIRYILSRYAMLNYDELKIFPTMTTDDTNFFNESPEIKLFLAIYHTLGNFMPIPLDCNSPRGIGKTKDYWDLTLRIIYEYYHIKEEEKSDESIEKLINCILGKNNTDDKIEEEIKKKENNNKKIQRLVR